MIHHPRAAACLPRSEGVLEELEFKKSSTWSTTLGLRHVYVPVCGRKSQVTSSRHIVVCLFAKTLWNYYIFAGVFFFPTRPQPQDKVLVPSLTISLPTTTKWQQRAPSWSTTLGLRHVYTEKRRSSRRARVQEELNMIHYPRAAACIRLRAEESSDFIEAHCGVPSREKPYEIVIYLHVFFFDLWYFRVRVSLRMWQEI